MPFNRQDALLDKDLVTELSQVAKYANHLKQIATACAVAEPGTDFLDITKAVAGETGLNPANIEEILNSLHSMARLRSRLHLSDEELIEKIRASLEANSDDEGKASVELWSSAAETILGVLRTIGPDHPILVARKLERLAYAHRYVMAEARLITELRPVYNEAGTAIIQAIIVNTLMIDFFDGSRTRRVEFGVDSGDLAELARISRRAERKAVVLKDALEGLPWRTSVYPDNESQ